LLFSTGKQYFIVGFLKQMKVDSKVRTVYLDNGATTRLDPRVLQAMHPYFEEHYGNASSVQNTFGKFAERSVERARAIIAGYFGATPGELYFTSGATESINTAIKSTVESFYPAKNHIIISAIEHPAVFSICRYLEAKGIRITVLPVDGEGFVDPDLLQNEITTATALVSLIAANNEIGTLQDIAQITTVVKEKGCLLHLDFAQATGKIPLNLKEMPIDLVSFSAHKVNGPKGIGALFVREGLTGNLPPLLHGGDQEKGLRGGTLNVPAIVGYGKAIDLLSGMDTEENHRMEALRNKLFYGLCSNLKNVYLNGPQTRRLFANLNVLLTGIQTTKFLQASGAIAFSTGSACATLRNEPSHVLLAIGRTKEEARSSFRFGVGRFTTGEDIDFAIDVLSEAAKKSIL
jgi:cysteine desulfurase